MGLRRNGGMRGHGEGRRSRVLSRAVALIGACVIELVTGLALVTGWRHRNPTAAIAPLGRVTQAILLRRRAPTRRRLPIIRGALVRGAPLGSMEPPSLPGVRIQRRGLRRRSLAYWSAAATVAARRAAKAQAQIRQYHPGSGELPRWWKSAWETPRARPSFPWSRQPLSSWFDVSFDRKTGMTVVRIGRRCRIVFLLIEPFFACVLDHLNPDPGRGDLFDRKYLPAPLVLPGPDLAPARPD